MLKIKISNLDLFYIVCLCVSLLLFLLGEMPAIAILLLLIGGGVLISKQIKTYIENE